MTRKSKYDFNYVKSFFESKGCQLLADCYLSANQIMPYKCSCGHITKTSFLNFEKSNRNWKSNSRCIKCRNKNSKQPKKLISQEVEDIFKKYDCELLSEYKNKKTKVTFKCKCGNIWTVFLLTFKKSIHHCCGECYNKKIRRGPNSPNWNPDREFVALRHLFHRRCCNLVSNVLNQTNQKKTKKKSEILGYSVEELRQHLMSHPNWNTLKGKSWDIDHVFPVSAFVKAKIFDLRIINSLDNLQPLETTENLKKAGKYDHSTFVVWLESKGVKII